MRNLIYIVFILVLITISCKKDDENQEHNPCGTAHIAYLTSPDLLNCRYKTGTYWVFIDSVKNTTDSLYIASYSQGFLKDMCGNSYENHTFTTISHPSMKQTDYIIVAGGLFKDFDGTPNSGTQIYNDYNSASSMTNFLITRFDSIFIYDRYYESVLQVEIDNDHTEEHNKSIYYINSEYGFLRHEIYSGNTLISNKNLKSKNIIK